MNLDLVVCPGCRTFEHDTLRVQTLTRDGDALACACGRRYPIVDGVPVVLEHADDYLAREQLATFGGEPGPEVSSLVATDATEDALLQHLSIYLDAQWGDHAVPPPDGEPFGARALVAKLAERATHRVAAAVELGCSVGRMTAELAAGADHVVALDLHAGAVRRARRLLDGEAVRYARRVTGRHYTTATAGAGDRATPPARRTLLVADALNPPLLPHVFERVVALNLLDSVPSPRTLLAVLDVLCAPGGEVILASPYAWQAEFVPVEAHLGGADPAGELARILREGDGLGARFRIEEEADLPWTLRRDARTCIAYRTHYVRARKHEGT